MVYTNVGRVTSMIVIQAPVICSNNLCFYMLLLLNDMNELSFLAAYLFHEKIKSSVFNIFLEALFNDSTKTSNVFYQNPTIAF